MSDIDIELILYKKLVDTCEVLNLSIDDLDKAIIGALEVFKKNNSVVMDTDYSAINYGIECLLYWIHNKTIIDSNNINDVTLTEINTKLHMDILNNLPFNFFVLFHKKEYYVIRIDSEGYLGIIPLSNNSLTENIVFIEKLDTIENMLNLHLKYLRAKFGGMSKKLIQGIFFPIFNILIYMSTQNMEIKETKVIEKNCTKSIKSKSNIKNERKILELNFKISDLNLSKPKIKYEYTDSKINTQKQTKTLASHIRKAHWHSFWTGSKKLNTRKLTTKWVSATLIKGTYDPVKIKKLK